MRSPRAFICPIASGVTRAMADLPHPSRRSSLSPISLVGLYRRDGTGTARASRDAAIKLMRRMPQLQRSGCSTSDDLVDAAAEGHNPKPFSLFSLVFLGTLSPSSHVATGNNHARS